MPEPASEADRERLAPNLAPDVLNWERVLLDVHAGRLFGIGGTVLNDLAALALVYLLISGLITWRRGIQRR